MKRILFVTLCMLASAFASADEGMWLLNNIDERTAQAMKQLGLQLSVRDLYNTNGPSLKDAVVDFSDYCSGVVVSPNGLLFTNYHCGYMSIQKLSTTEDDILDNGFVAHSYAEERPVDGLFVRFLDRTVDCTTRIKRGMEGLPNSQLDSVMNSVLEEYDEAFPDRHCEIKSYFGGSVFYVSIYKDYNDVRLVFSCPQSLGKFGGDTDNWMWPRQTCDFSVFRIYADANGDPAEYSEDNVPLSTPTYAQVCTGGYQLGDFCMTIGFPGSTSRYLSSAGVALRVNGSNISRIDVRGKKQAIWKRWMDADHATSIKYATKYATSSNYWKNSIGMNKAIEDLQVCQEKQRLEEMLSLWIQSDSSLTARFGNVIPTLNEEYAKVFDTVKAMGFFNETFNGGFELHMPASILSHLPDDADEKELEGTRKRLEAFYKDYVPQIDEEVTAALLQNYREQVSAEFLPPCYKTIDEEFGGDCAAYVHDLFSHTILINDDCLDKILADPALKELDPVMAYDNSLKEFSDAMRDNMKDDMEQIREGENMLTQALLEYDQDSPHYSDANFSMRLSYGYIQDYTANGTHFNYYTDSKSLLDKVAKKNEIEDYLLSDDIVSLLDGKDTKHYADSHTGDMHLCFLTNNDITGGNSGSPMFNGKGELIGLAFDGNWEAMSGDISFNADLQRCIGVDIRFVLFIIDRWGHADNVIKELGV